MTFITLQFKKTSFGSNTFKIHAVLASGCNHFADIVPIMYSARSLSFGKLIV